MNTLSNLDPALKVSLLVHLVNHHCPAKSEPLTIGCLEKLQTIVTISSSDIVSKCFNELGSPQTYPQLSERTFLVACVDRWVTTQVVAIYTLNQMKSIESLKGSGGVRTIEWRVMEISKELQEHLLQWVDLQSGCVVAPLLRAKL